MVHFSARDGRIWLAGQRMLLVHAASLGALRRELMGTIGREQTRRLLMRAGYASGERDGALARQVRGDASVLDMFAVGPQLHMLEGAAQVTPESCEIDLPAGRFHGVFRWDHSWEVEAHVRDFGPQDEPVCWMLLGYASGYTSAFMGRPTLFKEVACAACGQPSCRIEGRVLGDWPDAEALADDYAADSMIVRLEDLQSQVDTLRSTLQPADELGPLIGRSKAFDAAAGLLRKAAATQVTVLLTGETGVGKERFARALHAMSARAGKPFVAVNCAALPAELIESELFGAEKGAFTGAGAARPGRFERADGGTLLLDELGELPLTAQAKLLRVLQQGEIERLGSTQTRKVDVRVVAATNVDLQAAVASGRFRSDLMYRLNVYPIRIPPLRERVDDIESLAAHLLARFCALHGKRLPGFTDRALDAMRAYPWPGNVRELENLIERGVILASADELVDVHELFPTLPGQPPVTVNAAGELERGAPSGSPALYDELLARGLSLDGLEDALIQEAVCRAAAAAQLPAAARARPRQGLTRWPSAHSSRWSAPPGTATARPAAAPCRAR